MAPIPDWISSRDVGVLVFLRQTLRSDQRVGWSEQASNLHFFLVQEDGSTTPVQADKKAALSRALFLSTIRTKPDERITLISQLAQTEARLLEELRRPDETEIRQGIRYSVTPIFGAILTL